MTDIYTVAQDGGNKWWQVKGPSSLPHDSLWRTKEEAQRVAELLSRAYVKGQSSALLRFARAAKHE